MNLSPQDIAAVADLARLDLTEEEINRYAEQLSAVLAYMDILNEVETENVEETCQVTGLQDVFREDGVVSCDEDVRNKLVEAFPEREGDLLRVKAVFN